ncbi:MAG: hypothetical protein K2X47_06840 [Bdellovibrionales bacterium]|nr:hypothetical protein [Bdellovibrionales bacterium]
MLARTVVNPTVLLGAFGVLNFGVLNFGILGALNLGILNAAIDPPIQTHRQIDRTNLLHSYDLKLK